MVGIVAVAEPGRGDMVHLEVARGDDGGVCSGIPANANTINSKVFLVSLLNLSVGHLCNAYCLEYGIHFIVSIRHVTE